MKPVKYPSPLALGTTYRKPKTSLDGARSFLASENLIITAVDRNALAKVGGRVSLRPSATRRLGNYLDMSPLTVSGWTVQASPVDSNVFSGAPGDPYDRFVDATASVSKTRDSNETHLSAPLGEDRDQGFDHSAVLTYSSLYTIEGGERLISEQDVRLYFRRGEKRAHVIAVMRHGKEKQIVQDWLTAASIRAGLAVQPFRLKEELPERHDEVRNVLGLLGADLLATRHPKFFEQEGSQPPTGSDARYFKFRRWGTDHTWMVNNLDTVLSGAEEHELRIGSLNAFVFAGRETLPNGRTPGYIELRLRQEPGKDDALRISWVGGRTAPAARPAALTDDVWTEAALLDWTEDQKRAYLLSVWERIARLPARAAGTLRQTA